jgi:hypothetical protein
MVAYFEKQSKKLQTFDKDLLYYQHKIALYKEFVAEK